MRADKGHHCRGGFISPQGERTPAPVAGLGRGGSTSWAERDLSGMSHQWGQLFPPQPLFPAKPTLRAAPSTEFLLF